MARSLRISYPGAWYYIMNRGRRAQRIFHDAYDYRVFVRLLEESSEMWNIRIAAYCLMADHYHILMQTPDGNIARSMRHINGVYTQRFNRRHGCGGPLFRGRYKSILVNGDSYLLQLVRYIHRRPVKAGVASKLDGYMWSSHKGYVSVAKKWRWLYKEFVFSLLTKNREEWVKAYWKFVSIEKDEEISGVLQRKKWPSVLGPEAFVDWVKGKCYALESDEEVLQAKTLAPEADLIVKAVCECYDVRRADLYKSKRGEFNEPRNMAIFLTRQLRRDSLQEIGCEFRMENYSSISSIIERMKQRMVRNRHLKNRMGKVADRVNKRQAQT